MNIANLFGQSNGQDKKDDNRNLPERVLKIPHTQLESGIWSRDGKYGKLYSFSISGRTEDDKLFRTFGPEKLPEIAVTTYVLARYFSQLPDGASKKVKAGLADLADRLEALFGGTPPQAEEKAEVVPSQQPANGEAFTNVLAGIV